jgi:hypothetical protein
MADFARAATGVRQLTELPNVTGALSDPVAPENVTFLIGNRSRREALSDRWPKSENGFDTGISEWRGRTFRGAEILGCHSAGGQRWGKSTRSALTNAHSWRSSKLTDEIGRKLKGN